MDLRLFSRIPRLPIQQSYFLLADVWKKKNHWMDKIMWQTLGWSLKGGNGVSPAPVNICSVSWPEEPFVRTLKKNFKVFILWVFKKIEFSSVKTQFLTRWLCGFEWEQQIQVWPTLQNHVQMQVNACSARVLPVTGLCLSFISLLSS